MTSIPTPNIFITTNYQHIKNFFLAGNNLSIADLPNSNDSLLICGNKNKYLTHFELSYGFSNPTQQELILKFLDIDGKFEYTFFNKNATKDLFLEAFRNNINLGKSQNDNSRRLVNILNLATGQETIFCTFGFGENLNDWSNPTIFTLFDVKYDIQEKGIRSFTYRFQPSPGVLFRPRLFYNFDQANYNPEFAFGEYVNDITVVASEKEFFSEEYIKFTQNKIPPIRDYNLVIEKLLKKYVSKLTNTNEENIIVILPDFNKLIKEKFPDYHGKPTLDRSIGVSKELLRDFFGIDKTTNISEIQSTAGGLGQVLKPGTKPSPTTDALIEAASRQMTEVFFKMSALNKIDKDTSVLAPFPNWYSPINDITKGLKQFGIIDNVVVLEENDSKILNFWSNPITEDEDTKLIQNPSERCVIIGAELMIHQYLYRSGNLTGQNNLKVESPKYEKYLLDNALFRQINTESYTLKYFNTINKRKNSSSFSEKINLDELSIDELSKGMFSESISNNELLKLQDIPIFTNNLKNSNILSLNVDLGQTYLSQLRLASNEDFQRFVLGNFNDGLRKLKYDGIDASAILDRFKKDYYKNTSYFDIIYKPQTDKFSILKAGATTYSEEYPADLIGINKSVDGYKDANQKIEIVNHLLKDALARFQIKPETFDSTKSLYDVIYQSIFAGVKNRELTNSEMLGMALDKIAESPIEAIVGGGIRGDILNEENTRESRYKNAKDYAGITELILGKYKTLIDKYSDVVLDNKENIDVTKLILTDVILNMKNEANIPNTKDDKLRTYKFASYLFAINELNLDNGITITPRIGGLPQNVLAGEIFNHIARQQIKISIKTLPFFHLSNFRTIQFKPCFLFSKRTNIHYSQSGKNNLAAEENFEFFSGNYNITAFRHTITTRECYSEFLLQKTTATTQYY